MRIVRTADAEVKDAIKKALALKASSNINIIKILATDQTYSILLKVSPDQRGVSSSSRAITVRLKKNDLHDQEIPNLLQNLRHGRWRSRIVKRNRFEEKYRKRILINLSSLPGDVTDHDPEDGEK